MNVDLVQTVLRLSDPIAHAMAHALWMGGILGLFLLVGLRLVPVRRARLRYAAACATLLLMVLLPLVQVLSEHPRDLSPAEAATGAQPSAQSSSSGGSSALTAIECDLSPGDAPAAPIEAAREQRTPLLGWRDRIGGARWSPLKPWLATGWILGVLLLAIRRTSGWWWTRSVVRSAGGPAPESWKGALTVMSRRVGVTRAVELRLSARARVPLLIGWVRPVIVVPVAMACGLTPGQVDAIVAHELAHVRRWDVLAGHVLAAAEMLLFFHPVAWWVARTIRREREHCCDDLAAAACGGVPRYARALLAIEERRAHAAATPATATAMAADAAPLLPRIRRLVGGSGRAPASQGGLAGIMTVLSLVGLLVLLPGEGGLPATATAQPPVHRGEPDVVGEWSLRSEDLGWLFELEYDHNSRTAIYVEPQELTGFARGDDVRFSLERDAGTLVFEGAVTEGDRLVGVGEFTFYNNPDYLEQMAMWGFRLNVRREPWLLALQNVSLDDVRALRELGYDDISESQLIQFAVHRVTPEFIRAMEALGYRGLSAQRLVQFRVHRVTSEFITALAELGYDDLSPSELVQFRVHGISPGFIRELAERGFDDLAPDELVRIKVHGIDRYMRRR